MPAPSTASALRTPARASRGAFPAPPTWPDGDTSRLVGRLTLAFLAVGLIARLVRYLVQGALWGDECAVARNLAARDFVGLARPLDHQQVAPVLFLWAERVAYLLLGSSELALRLLPLLAGSAGLVVFWDFARRAVPPVAACLAVGVLAVARWPVYMSATLKPYTWDLLAAAVLMSLAHRWRTAPDRLGPLALLVLAVPVAVFASYPSVFVAGAVVVYLLPVAWRHPDRRAKLLFAAYGLALTGAFAALYLLMLQQQGDPAAGALMAYMRDYWAHGFPPADPAAFLEWLLTVHTGRMFAFPIGDSKGGSAVPFLLFAGGAVVCWRSRDRSLLVLCLGPFAITFAAAVMGKYPYGGCCRLAQHLAPAMCLLIGVGAAATLDRFDHARRMRGLIGLAVALVGFGCAQVVFDLARPDRDAVCAWSRQFGRELDRHLKPGDRVVLASPRYMMDQTTDWQLTRLGERVCWDAKADAAAAPRVWVLTITDGPVGQELEAAAVARLGPGRVEVARVLYAIPPDDELNFYWCCRVVCLARPDHAADSPLLRASP
jgi:hypothetical protein